MKNKLTAVISVSICLLMVLSIFTACSLRKGNQGDNESTTLTPNDVWSPDNSEVYQPVQITDVELVELVSKALGDEAVGFDGNLSSLTDDQIEKVKKVAEQEGLLVDTDDQGNTVIKKEEPVPQTVIVTTAAPSSLVDEILSDADITNTANVTPEEYSKVSKAAEDRGATAVTDKNRNVTIYQTTVKQGTTAPVSTNANNVTGNSVTGAATTANENVTSPTQNNTPTTKKNNATSTPAPAETTGTWTTAHFTTLKPQTTIPPTTTVHNVTKRTKSMDKTFAQTYGDGAPAIFKNSVIVEDSIISVGNIFKNSAGKSTEYSNGLVVRYTTDGKQKWNDIISGDEITCLEDVILLADGNILVAGYTYATDMFSDEEYRCKDTIEGILIKYNLKGDVLWKKAFGGGADDIVYCAAATPDGGFIIGGKSDSEDYDFSNTGTGFKAYVAKFTSDGKLLWKQSLNGSQHCTVNDVAAANDGTIYVSIDTLNKDGDFAGIKNEGGLRYSVVEKLSSDGKLQWKKAIYESGILTTSSIAAVPGGGCIVVGDYSLERGKTDGEFTLKGAYNGGPSGSYDGFYINFDKDGNIEWKKTLVGFESDHITSITPVSYGFVLAGYTTSTDRDYTFGNNGDFDSFVVSIANDGEKLVTKSISGSGSDRAMGVIGKGENVYVCGSTVSTDIDFASVHGDGTNSAGFLFGFKLNQE